MVLTLIAVVASLYPIWDGRMIGRIMALGLAFGIYKVFK